MRECTAAVPDDLIPTKDAADMLKVSPNTLTLWRKRSQGPNYYKFGRQCRYSRAEMKRFITSNFNITNDKINVEACDKGFTGGMDGIRCGWSCGLEEAAASGETADA